ncbi:MAG: DegT/DnrJ/EryC1/StrS aminotransferase family protein [Phycisphaeraceae bacterium]
MIPIARPCIGEAEQAAVNRVFESRWLGMGEVTQRFEDRLREYLGVKHVIATSRGTAALHLALDALDLQPGDEVIVPSLTFVATVQAIVMAGATPVFCEVNPSTLNIEVEDALRRITERTRAIMPVHFGGLACDMDALLPAAHEQGIAIVEDAAHAFGSTYRGRPIGTLGDLTCFSFHAIKNITCGEGGAVATNHDHQAKTIAQRRYLGIDQDTWRREGQLKKWQYRVVSHGFRYHMSDINAAIGLAQLDRLEDFAAHRRRIVRRYDDAFGGVEGITLLRRDLHETIPHMYVIRVNAEQRDVLVEHLAEQGVGAGVHYAPIHLQPVFDAYRVCLPVTEQLYGQIITLPLYVEMTDEQIGRVIASVSSFFKTSVLSGVV